VVATLGGKEAAKQLGDYINAIARFREGGALEETYRSDFEQGIAEAIRDWMYGSVALTLKERRRRRLTRVDSSRLAIRARLNLMCRRCGRG
jgi:hypothetical protein